MGTTTSPHPGIFRVQCQSKLSTNCARASLLKAGPWMRVHWAGRGPRGPEHRAASRLSPLGSGPLLRSGDENVVPPPMPLLDKGGDKDAPRDGVWEERSCGDTWDCQLFPIPRPMRRGVPRATGPGPSHVLYSRFLGLIALQAAHLTHVHLGCVYVCVHQQLILANAGKGRPGVRGGWEVAGVCPQGGRLPRSETVRRRCMPQGAEDQI